MYTPLTVNNMAFHPQFLLKGLFWLSEQKEIFSLSIIKQETNFEILFKQR
jgi:hypothetical protein